MWVGFSACGYRFAGSGSLPAGIKTISIPIFENRTAETGLENIVTNDLIYEVTRSRGVALVRKDKAEANLSGVIVSTQTGSISRSSVDISTERRVTLTLNLKLANTSGIIIWSAQGVAESEAYVVEDDKQGTEQNRQDALSRASKRLAENIYNRLTEDF
ncbi:MAG: LptE family protein [Candidatus Desulfatibia sp.]|uniref:LPS assembly lipoprotein LptE n=1 Tax=Candidatus Desulfatibia sp. TaxID=3101189 RepID=UPI002F2D93AB